MLDGMRRQRGIRTCSTRRPRRPQFRRGAFNDVGGLCTRSSHRESGLSCCRAEEQSAPEARASAAPRSGGGDAVPSERVVPHTRRGGGGHRADLVGPNRDERGNLAVHGCESQPLKPDVVFCCGYPALRRAIRRVAMYVISVNVFCLPLSLVPSLSVALSVGCLPRKPKDGFDARALPQR